MNFRLIIRILIMAAIINFAGCGGMEKGHNDSDSHEGHDHANEEVPTDEHEGHDHANEVESTDDHAEEIEISDEGIKMAGITMSKAEKGSLSKIIRISGETVLNSDKTAKITPRFGGLVKLVGFMVGDFVKSGETVAVIESNESMTEYSIKSPISGIVIERNFSIGSYVSEEADIYLIADMSTVWLNLSVYPKDAEYVKEGHKARLKVVSRDISSEGTISYIDPIIDKETRRITARMVIPNIDNKWRPGTFVTAEFSSGQNKINVIIDKKAVQIIEDKTVVFISDEPNRFMPVNVVTGESNHEKIIILSGISENDSYVSGGAFDIKAKIITSSLGSHAGHGH